MALPRTIVGVIGGRRGNTTPEAMTLAERAGEELGRRGIAIVCGGEDGIMEAACEGCKRAGGVTIGVMTGRDPRRANSHIDYAILTSMGLARNNIIVSTAAGILAFDGSYGTLTETALALDMGIPLISLGRQRLVATGQIDSPWFAHYEGYDLGQVPLAVQHLLRFIEEQRA